MGQESIDGSKFISPKQFSIPKVDRGLLSRGKQKGPAPNHYRHEHIPNRMTKNINPRCTMGTASRDIPFAKYSSGNNILIAKGLF
jgi:hypothetical protein